MAQRLSFIPTTNASKDNKDKKHGNARLQKFPINLQEYDYKVEYIKGKDNACPDILSWKDDCKKQPVPSTEELASKIFDSQFHSASGILDAHPTVTNISSVEMLPPFPNTANINVITWAMPKQHADQATLAACQLPPAKFQPLTVKAISITMRV
uniref:Uncharacterized protein n=1 Tax=Romanomermis culicivorax TaxID=13658 RepID=A0A915KN96_ROMCU